MNTFIIIFRKLKDLHRLHGKYKQALLILFILLIGGAVSIYLLERSQNDQFKTFVDGLWWAIVTITTVGYGDKYPVTVAGKIVALIVMFGGIGSFGYIAGSLLEDIIKKGQGKMTVLYEDHYVICSYSFKADKIIKELKAELKKKRIVLIADKEENPVSDMDDVTFVRGDSTKETTLEKANVGKANTVIVLADGEMDDYMADAHSVLTTLAVKHISPNCKVVAESLNPENIEHFQRAGADEIICTGALSSKLIFRSSIYSGVANLFKELLTNSYGHEIYSGKVPDYLVNSEYKNALAKLKESEAILIGIQQGDQFITNPPGKTLLQKDDKLIYIAPHRVI